MPLNTTPHSYRADPMVPEFDDVGQLTVMDARCGLCAKGARWIAHNDKKSEFQIILMQSELGAALFRHYGIDPDDPASWLYMEDGLAYSSADAIIRVGQRLGGIWKALIMLRIIPPFILDYCYGLVARNRIRLSGTADLCNLPDPEIQKRLLQ